MIKASGIHHIAIMTDDIKKHIAFFSDVLGCRLSAIFDMHGVPGGLHAFMHLNDHSYFSIVELPEAANVPIELGVTHAGTGSGVSAPGTMQHLAFRVDNADELIAMRDRIRTKGVNVIGPLDHGMCQSIYFAGPDNMALEVACPGVDMDAAQWVDPSVLEKAGIFFGRFDHDRFFIHFFNQISFMLRLQVISKSAYDIIKLLFLIRFRVF